MKKKLKLRRKFISIRKAFLQLEKEEKQNIDKAWDDYETIKENKLTAGYGWDYEYMIGD